MANPADDQRSQPVVARVVRRLTPQYRPMRRPLSTFVRLSAGGDWIRTISSARADSDVRMVDYRVEAAELVDLVANCSRPTDGGEVPRTAPRAPAAVAKILPPRARSSMRCETQRRQAASRFRGHEQRTSRRAGPT